MFKTDRGYDYFELLSALQKDLRRGNEYEAMFWAVELESFNLTALWNRLNVIASEDVGVANPVMPFVIETLERKYYDARKRDSSADRLFLSNAILNLSRSRKTRVADDSLVVVYGEILLDEKRLNIPDYALDMHTKRGKALGRGLEHFYTVANKLSNEDIDNPYTEKAKEIREKILERFGTLELEFEKENKIDKNHKQNSFKPTVKEDISKYLETILEN